MTKGFDLSERQNLVQPLRVRIGDAVIADDAMPDGSSRLRVLGSWWLLASVILLVYAVSPVLETSNDPKFVPMTTHSLVHDGNLSLDEFGPERLLGHPLFVTDGSLSPGQTVWVPDVIAGAVEDPAVDIEDYFPWTTSLVLIPAVVAVDALSAGLGTASSGELIREGQFDRIHEFTAALVVTAGLLLIRSTALLVLGGARQRKQLLANGVALVAGLGTAMWSTASRALWQHTPSFLVLCAAIYLATSIDRRRRVGGELRSWDCRVVALGAASVAAVIARPTNLAVGVGLIAWTVFVHRRWILPAVLGATVTAAAFVVSNLLLTGRVVPAYYASSRIVLGDWFVEAIAANWISPSRGLVVASPFVILAIPGAAIAWRQRERRALVIVLAGSVVAVTASVSAFAHWWAGHSFGPRFMSEAIPQLCVLALPAVDWIFDPVRFRVGWVRYRLAAFFVVVLATLSVSFHAVGSIFIVSQCWNRYPEDIDRNPSRVWVITESQVLEAPHRYLDAGRRAAQDAVCADQ